MTAMAQLIRQGRYADEIMAQFQDLAEGDLVPTHPEGGFVARTVDTHVSLLRQKLGLTPDQGWQLKAIYQHGYRLERLQENSAAVG